MRGLRFLFALVLVALCGVPSRADTAANFWISTSSGGSPGPEAPALSPTVGDVVTLHIWGRPAEGRQFEAVSLNLVALSDGVDFLDGTIAFYNTGDAGVDRFEHVADSTTTPTLTSDYTAFELGVGGGLLTDAVRGIDGFTLTGTTPRPPGPVCATGELNCEIAGDGEPAWLIASLDVQAIAAGVVDLHLQVGDRGVVERTLADGDYDLAGEVDSPDHTVWTAEYGGKGLYAADGNGDRSVDAADYTVWRDHLGDVATSLAVVDSDVRFGVDAMAGTEPAHNALTDRETNLMGDDPDMVLTISAPALAVPEPSAAALSAVLFGLISNRRPRPTE